MDARRSVSSLQERARAHRTLSSSSGLHYGALVNSTSSLPGAEVTAEAPAPAPVPTPTRDYVAVAVLCYVNLLNYMERYTIAGVLLNIQKFFEINDSTSGFLQTVFIFSFLLLAPLFGYLGDRYNRKYIIVGGVCVWLVTAAASSFVTKQYFWVLVLTRAMVGIGEASYTTIAPTIIADLFTGSRRSIMISAFYIFIPVGSGLGFISGSSIAALTGNWHWALRLTPILGLVGLVLLVCFCPNPPRGSSGTQVESGHSPYIEDVKYLLKNKSFVWSTLGVTAMAFLTGAFAFWMPTFLYRAQVFQGNLQPCVTQPCDNKDSYVFGAVTVTTGILGVCIGTALSRYLRDRVPNADPIICGVAMLGSVPCLLLIIFVAGSSIPVTYVFVFVGELLLSLNWPILADILLYVVIPTRRATGEALQITFCHLLGDAGSPFLIGAISDAISRHSPESEEWSFHSLKYSLLLCPFVGVLGGVFFLMTACYIVEDKKVAQQLAEEASPNQVPAAVPNFELSTEVKAGNETTIPTKEDNRPSL